MDHNNTFELPIISIIFNYIICRLVIFKVHQTRAVPDHIFMALAKYFLKCCNYYIIIHCQSNKLFPNILALSLLNNHTKKMLKKRGAQIHDISNQNR